MPSTTTIEKAIAEYKPEKSMRFVPKKDLKSSQILHAKQHFSKLTHLDDVVGMMDTTLLKSGKEGFVLTQPLLHVHMLYDAQVPLDSMKSASCKDHDVTVTYKNGSTVKFYASIYDGDLCRFLNTLAKLSEEKLAASAAESETKPSTAPAAKTRTTPKQEPKTSPAPAPKPEPKPVSRPEPSPAPAPKAQPAPAQKNAAPGAADFDKGTEAYRRGDNREAFRLYKLAADAGNALAMFNLSMLSGRARELPAAFDWMLRSARARYIPAYSRVAQMYLKGIGTEKDYYAAQYWARKAVQNGDANAQTLLSQADGIIRDFLRSLEVGNRFTFGNYPQTEDGQRMPICWRVLDKQADKLLVISEYVLEKHKFDVLPPKVPDNWRPTWATCELRTWLHSDFWKTAFAETDTFRILTTNVHTPSNPDYSLIQKTINPSDIKVKRDTTSSPDSADKLFLLSWDEVIHYLCDGWEPNLQSLGFRLGKREISELDSYWFNFSDLYAAAQPTPYILRMDADLDILHSITSRSYINQEPYAFCDWWLRSSCLNYKPYRYSTGGFDASYTTLYVCSGYYRSASICSNDTGITFKSPIPGSIAIGQESDCLGVRPAMWLDLK